MASGRRMGFLRQIPFDASWKPYFIRWEKLRPRVWEPFSKSSGLGLLHLERRIVGLVVAVVVVDIDRGNVCCAGLNVVGAQTMRRDAALNMMYMLCIPQAM